jgi:hypothetical protein
MVYNDKVNYKYKNLNKIYQLPNKTDKPIYL